MGFASLLVLLPDKSSSSSNEPEKLSSLNRAQIFELVESSLILRTLSALLSSLAGFLLAKACYKIKCETHFGEARALSSLLRSSVSSIE